MRGRVKWFNTEKGFGFVTAEDGEDLFVHFSYIDGRSPRELSEGEYVEFEREMHPKGAHAVHVKVVPAPPPAPTVVTGWIPRVLQGEGAAASHATPPSRDRLRVFLCHASGDKPKVRTLFRRLSHPAIELWLDEERLLPGQDWQFEIAREIRTSDVVLVCLSPQAVSKAGFVQKEIRHALDVADEQPEGSIFIIPVLLEPCDVPQRLTRWQWVDISHERGFDRLLRALQHRASSRGVSWE